MIQTKGKNRDSGFQAVVCAREWERREKVCFRMWCAPGKWREEE